VTETTALGAAYLAGLGIGFWESAESIREHWQVDKEFIPHMDNTLRNDLLQGWKRAVKATIAWADM
jgi:glycerol kinase